MAILTLFLGYYLRVVEMVVKLCIQLLVFLLKAVWSAGAALLASFKARQTVQKKPRFVRKPKPWR